MSDAFPADIYTEPSDIDVHTLRNLGPLTAMAGVWTGDRGLDVKPKADGPRKQAFVERMELQPIDPQTNGPQLFTAFVTTPTSSSPSRSRPTTSRSATGCGSRPPAR
jgi:hypothetical protein